MAKVIVIEFMTLDGVVEDPDGAAGSKTGGWAFRYGPQAVAGDKFGLGPLLDSGVLLLGRRTWEHFSHLWPVRTDDFSRKMNAIEKLVASHSLDRVDSWAHSTVLHGDLVENVALRKAQQDVIVVGSLSVAHLLMAHDLVDEYRLLVFPVVVGQGQRLFREGWPVTDLALTGTETKGAAVLLTYERVKNAGVAG